MSIRSYSDLKIWQVGIELAVHAYKLTERLPKAEQYGLTSQMRRAATSIPANIAEGYQRHYDTELRHFLYMAYGSLAELETFAHLCERLGYLNGDVLEPLLSQSAEIGRMLNGFIRKIRSPES
jgi:four helix bundle protein